MARITPDLKNLRFGRLVALHRVPRQKPGTDAMWLCSCDCGTTTSASSVHLRNGGHKSCGCLRRDTVIQRCLKHGQSARAEYLVWYTARRRCHDPSDKRFYNYGGRGITMCERW